MNLITEISSQVGSHIPIKELILQAGIADRSEQLCDKYSNKVMICDENTKAFVDGNFEKIILPGDQKPELQVAEQISKIHADCFIAVGSGSINDIVKYASYLAKKPYVVFGTAPSMNGYVSANASLLDNGYKKSFSANAPEAVYLDLEILKNAPKRLINSGIGDSICRSVVEADVKLSHQALSTPLYNELFTLMKKDEEKIFDDVEALTRTLIYSGIAMLVAHSSAPASQSEHMLAHYMELMQPEAPHSFHGEQIAVTTLTMAKLQEQLLAENDYIEIPEIDRDLILKHFGNDFGQYCIEQTAKKYKPLQGKKIAIDKKKIESDLVKYESIHTKLKSFGTPLTPSDIGWDQDTYNNAVKYSRYTRDRFTCLDLQPLSGR